MRQTPFTKHDAAGAPGFAWHSLSRATVPFRSHGPRLALYMAAAAAIAEAGSDERMKYLGWHHIGWGVADWWLVLTVPILLGSILLVLTMIWVNLRSRHKEQSTARVTSEKAFADGIERCKLSPSEVQEVHSLLAHDRAVQPQVIFQSFTLFERCVHARLAEAQRTEMPAEQMQDLEMTISSVRRKLGFHYLPTEHPLVSTRNIASGQGGSLFGSSNRTPLVQKATVVRNTESFFRIQYDAEKEEGARLLSPGSHMRFVFSRQGDGFYGVSVPILTVSGRGTADLGHTLEIKRNQMRSYVRVPADLPMKFRLVRTADPEKSEVPIGAVSDARMVDISGGGLSFIFQQQLKAGDLLALTFGFGNDSFAGVTGKIVRISLQKVKDESTFKHHIQFETIAASKREKIVRGVFDKLRVLSAWK